MTALAELDVTQLVKGLVALLVFLGGASIVIAAFRRAGYKGPFEVVGLLERLIDVSMNGSGPDWPGSLPVNVELRDGADGRFGLPEHASVRLRNSHGNSVALSSDAFEGCDPRVFKHHAHIDIIWFDGLIERGRIFTDPETGHLFVRSTRTRLQILAALQGR